MFLAIYRKTLGDISEPKSILTYLTVFVGVLFFLGVGSTNEVPDAVATLPLTEQEVALMNIYTAISYLWGAGIGLLAAGALFVSLTLATEAQRGTLDLVLSKPVRRPTVLLAMFLANVTFLFAVGIASLLLVAVTLYGMGGFSAAALGRGVIGMLLPLSVYTLLVCTLVVAVGMAASVYTRNRLRTASMTAILPALFFGLFVARVFPGSIYEDYSLYLLDVSYHLGNVYTLLLETLVGPLPTEVQARLGFWTGVYEVPDDPSAVEGSLELIGYVDPIVSLALCSALTVGSLTFALVKFQRFDI